MAVRENFLRRSAFQRFGRGSFENVKKRAPIYSCQRKECQSVCLPPISVKKSGSVTSCISSTDPNRLSRERKLSRKKVRLSAINIFIGTSPFAFLSAFVQFKSSIDKNIPLCNKKLQQKAEILIAPRNLTRSVFRRPGKARRHSKRAFHMP